MRKNAMDHSTTNGQHPHADDDEPVNVYADAIRGTRPREIVDFEMDTDPYANVVPIMSRRRPSVDAEHDWDDGDMKRNPWMVGISILLIVLLVLPPLVVVFARLGL